MIILHDARLIFLKPVKVAGTSFEIALSKFASSDCILTPISPADEELRRHLGFRGAQNYQNSRTAGASNSSNLPNDSRYYNHIPAHLAKDACDAGIWDNYLKVSIIRNPFEVSVSMFFWYNRKSALSSLELLKSFGPWILERKDWLLSNNSAYQIDGENIIEHMIRYEKFEQDIISLEELQPKLAGLWETFKNINAKSGIRPKEATVEEVFKYNLPARDFIYNLFLEQIDRYEFSVPD